MKRLTAMTGERNLRKARAVNPVPTGPKRQSGATNMPNATARTVEAILMNSRRCPGSGPARERSGSAGCGEDAVRSSAICAPARRQTTMSMAFQAGEKSPSCIQAGDVGVVQFGVVLFVGTIWMGQYPPFPTAVTHNGNVYFVLKRRQERENGSRTS